METVAGKPESAAPDRKTRFDLAERERIRSALQRYMEAHAIGVPTLQVRIADAAGRSQDLIPLKTLQRFLAGATRTNDAFLVPCHQFASGLPDREGPQEVTPDDLAQALFGFYRPPVSGAVPAPGSEAPAILKGDYEVCTPRITGPPSNSRIRAVTRAQSQRFDVPYATLDVASASGGLPSSVRERVFNPSQKFPFKQDADEPPRHIYEGTGIQFTSLIFALFRNLVTRLPKAYWLRPGSQIGFPATLVGYGIESRFLTDDVTLRGHTASTEFAVFPLKTEKPS